MSYYGLGFGTLGLADDRGPFEIVTPARALAEMRSIDTDIGSLGRDIQRSEIDADFKAEFAIFATEWRAFFDDYNGGPLAWAGRTQPNVIKKIDEYRKTADAWRATFIQHGGQATAVARVKPSGWGPWPYIALGAGLAVGAWWYLSRDAGSVRRVDFKGRK